MPEYVVHTEDYSSSLLLHKTDVNNTWLLVNQGKGATYTDLKNLIFYKELL